MGILSAIFVFLLAVIPEMLANPIAVDSSQRAIIITQEDVSIVVSSASSQVHGVYHFKLAKSDWPDVAGMHITIDVPIFLPRNVSLAAAAAFTRPVIRISNRKFTSKKTSYYADGRSAIRGIPRDWNAVLFSFEIPLRDVSDEFVADIRYTQPHFHTNISAYFPIHPPKAVISSKISFVPDTQLLLRLRSKHHNLFASTPESVIIRPVHGELIRVQSTQKPFNKTIEPTIHSSALPGEARHD